MKNFYACEIENYRIIEDDEAGKRLMWVIMKYEERKDTRISGIMRLYLM